MTFCVCGFRVMNLVIGPCSCGSVTRTTYIYPIRELGPHSWTTCGSRVSRRSSNRGCPVPSLIACYTRCAIKKPATAPRSRTTARDAYVVGGHKDDNWDPDCPRPSMPFVPLGVLMFLLGDVFDGHRQQDDPALFTLHACGDLSPPPLWVVDGRPACDTACKAVWGREEWAIVLLLTSGPAQDVDESPVP